MLARYQILADGPLFVFVKKQDFEPESIRYTFFG
jgi:hypothetical protein